MLRRLLVWLGLMCHCGGWRTMFRWPAMKVATVRFVDGSEQEIKIRSRPCKRCGWATVKETRIRLHGEGVEVGPGRAKFDPEKL